MFVLCLPFDRSSIPHGGALLDFTSIGQWNDQGQFWGWLAFNVVFFLIISVLVLNVIFALIVDTFGSTNKLQLLR
jgi:hypothetical protein